MSNYKVEVKGNNIEITNNNKQIVKILINSLYLNNGNHVNDVKELVKDQQKINYLNSIKDGSNIFIMQDLDIYPKAKLGGFPIFPNDLKKIEKNILQEHDVYLENMNWLKVKKGSLLESPQDWDDYQRVIWDSGLGYNVFFSKPDSVITVKTFGSYIHPIKEQHAKEVWPPIGSSINLTNSFMKIMGFGDYSSITAKTESKSAFNYKMNIDCGINASQCSLSHTGSGPDPNINYFINNNSKKQNLNNRQEIVKTIMVKELGNKAQVLIYLIYYYLLNSEGNETVVINGVSHPVSKLALITCDMTTFMLCQNLSIPCIYTGIYNPPGIIQEAGKKYYSIVKYKPRKNPASNAYNRSLNKINCIVSENESFIKALSNLAKNDGTYTRISVGKKTVVFSKEFYEKILEDLNEIQNLLKKHRENLQSKYSKIDETKEKSTVSDINNIIKNIESQCIIVPFIKIKNGPTPKTLTILMTKSYTVEKPVNISKPSIKNYLMSRGMDKISAEKESQKSFYEIATNPKNGFLVQTTKNKVGNILSEKQINLFPEDDDTNINTNFTDGRPNLHKYIYKTNGEIENNSITYNEKLDSNTPLFNPNISESIQTKNLLSELKKSFSTTFYSFLKKHSIIGPYNTDNFKETIYILFVYESFINGCGKVVFDNDDLTRIINDYKLMQENEGKKTTSKKIGDRRRVNFKKNKFTKKKSIKYSKTKRNIYL